MIWRMSDETTSGKVACLFQHLVLLEACPELVTLSKTKSILAFTRTRVLVKRPITQVCKLKSLLLLQ